MTALLTAGLLGVSGGVAAPPNAGLIVFENLADHQLYSVAPSGADLKQLTSPTSLGTPENTPDRTAQSPAVSFDGTRIAFVVIAAPATADDPTVFQLWVMNSDGSNAVALPISSTFATIGHPTWSPNGKSIAFVQTAGAGETWILYVANADGSKPRAITQRFAYDPSWSPDGKSIAFHSFEQAAGAAPGPSGIYVVTPSGANLHRVTPIETGPEQTPIWSTNGRWLAYSRLDPDWQLRSNYSQPLYEVRPDGTGAHQLTTGAGVDFAGAFSPDDKQLVFERIADPKHAVPRLYLMNSDRTHLRRFLPTVSGISPVWAVQPG